jgi:pyruvate/2-oxoglutarate dehydrogenase complex dihydrolipoamide acyltransferase (E2) component
MSVAQDILAPQDNANDDVITIVGLPCPNGARVAAGSVVLEYENSKSTVELRAEADGFINYFCVVDQEVPIGTRIASITSEPLAGGSAAPVPETAAEGSLVQVETRFSRAAAVLMESMKLDQSAFAGQAFVTSADVRSRVRIPGTASGPEGGAGPQAEAPIPGPGAAPGPAFSTESLPPEKRTEIRYLSQVQPGNLNSSVFVSLSARGLMEYVSRNSAFFKKSNLPLVLKAVHPVLLKHREFNAFYSPAGISRYHEVVIGLALDLGKGLKVVKLPDVSLLSLSQIEVAVMKQLQRYFKDELTPAELGGSTFTITDLSQEGVLFFTPLINRRQSAVLSVCAYNPETGFQTLGLTFDHRLATGRDAAAFLRELKGELESLGEKSPIWSAS